MSFRKDQDTITKLLAIRNWINEVAKAELTFHEVEDKIDWLISDYERHMQLCKMKYNYGLLEVVVTVGAEFAENFLKLKWGKAAKKLFALKYQKIKLLETERNAPGSAVSYILKCRGRLSN